MQNHPVGIFDSGVGGLSVAREIRRLLPRESLLYIADSIHAPYGNKPLAFIRQRSHDLSRFLIEQGAKAIVVACNTATAAAVAQLREAFPIPIIAMEPGVKPAIAATRSGKVGVLATENTLTSEQFADLLHRYAREVEVISQPCPGLVEQIEVGEFDSETTRQLIQRYTAPLLRGGADTIVLGCTHYPLVRFQIEAVVGPEIAIIDTGLAVAQQLLRVLDEQNLLTDTDQAATIKYWTSGESAYLKNMVYQIFQQDTAVSSLPI